MVDEESAACNSIANCSCSVYSYISLSSQVWKCFASEALALEALALGARAEEGAEGTLLC